MENSFNKILSDTHEATNLASPWLYGTLPKGINCQAIVQRACPTTC